jgi:hypothetical protein
MWSKTYFSSEIKTFLFKFHHNILGINSRVHHINPDRDPACFFCVKTKNCPSERETFSHFFWFCPVTFKLIKNFESEFLTCELTDLQFFTGTDENGIFSEALLIVCNIFRYSLWSFKLKHRIPSWPALRSELLYNLNIITGGNNKLNGIFNNCLLFRRNRERV